MYVQSSKVLTTKNEVQAYAQSGSLRQSTAHLWRLLQRMRPTMLTSPCTIIIFRYVHLVLCRCWHFQRLHSSVSGRYAYAPLQEPRRHSLREFTSTQDIFIHSSYKLILSQLACSCGKILHFRNGVIVANSFIQSNFLTDRYCSNQNGFWGVVTTQFENLEGNWRCAHKRQSSICSVSCWACVCAIWAGFLSWLRSLWAVYPHLLN